MSKKSTAASRAPKTPSPNEGAIARLGRELAQLIKNDPDNCDCERKKRNPGLYEEMSFACSDKRDAICERISFSRVVTPADAVALIVVASGALGLLQNYGPSEPGTGSSAADHSVYNHDKYEAGKLARTLNRCMHSLLRYFETQHGVDAREFGADFYMVAEVNCEGDANASA